jgi:hypothetical protein
MSYHCANTNIKTFAVQFIFVQTNFNTHKSNHAIMAKSEKTKKVLSFLGDALFIGASVWTVGKLMNWGEKKVYEVKAKMQKPASTTTPGA